MCHRSLSPSFHRSLSPSSPCELFPFVRSHPSTCCADALIIDRRIVWRRWHTPASLWFSVLSHGMMVDSAGTWSLEMQERTAISTHKLTIRRKGQTIDRLSDLIAFCFPGGDSAVIGYRPSMRPADTPFVIPSFSGEDDVLRFRWRSLCFVVILFPSRLFYPPLQTMEASERCLSKAFWNRIAAVGRHVLVDANVHLEAYPPKQ